MQEFFRFVYSQNLIFMFFIIVLAVVIWTFFALQIKNGKKLYFIISNGLIFTVILVVIAYRTLLAREAVHIEVELTPFKLFLISSDKNAVIRSFFMNVLLFVPMGLSMPYVLSKKPRKRNIFITTGLAAVLSAGIEFAQYYYHLGRCETDDVIANTLGAAVGTLSYCLYMKILKNQEKGSFMQNTLNGNQILLLQLCSKSLFGKDIVVPDEFDSKLLIDEANRQTVFPLVYSFIKDKLDNNADKHFSQIIAKNIRVEYGHNEVHRVLTKNNIPYVVLKGVASASYYKEPMLRTMGDIDILVSPDNIANADALLKSMGFVTTDDIDGDDMHIGYKRKDGVACELHRRINGVPQNEAGDTVNKYLSDIFDKVKEYKTANGVCVVPDKFHHGLILLLHTASHLTHEGVGLRHLCDWAVFVNDFSNDEFISLFEKPLKEMGLWRFAQLLTLCCVKYLGCDSKEWAGDGDDVLLEGIIVDILNGGNFGLKDPERYSQIKYISNRKNGTVGKKIPILQLLSSINAKTKKEFDFVNMSKLLLPIGWLFTVCKYLYMVITGKRSLDGISTINSANNRKNIYNEFHLFEK